MITDPLLLAVMGLAVIILGLSKGGIAGIGMASTPMVAAVIDPLTAVALMLPIMLVQDGVAVLIYRRRFDARIVRHMIPGGAIGVLAAYFLAANVPEWTVKAVLGAVSLCFALWQFIVHFRGIPAVAAQYRHDRALALCAGAASGFTSAVAHAGPPPFQIYVMPKHLEKEIFVGTSVMFFAAVNLMKLPSFVALGLFDAAMLGTSALFVPLAVAASWAGAWLVRFIDAQKFRLVITSVLLAISLVLLLQAGLDAGLH
jgi:hypothetical protein